MELWFIDRIENDHQLSVRLGWEFFFGWNQMITFNKQFLFYRIQFVIAVCDLYIHGNILMKKTIYETRIIITYFFPTHSIANQLEYCLSWRGFPKNKQRITNLEWILLRFGVIIRKLKALSRKIKTNNKLTFIDVGRIILQYSKYIC